MSNLVNWRSLGGAFVVAAIVAGFPSKLAGQPAPRADGLAWGAFAPNLPVIFLEVKGPIVREQKTPCTARFQFPPGTVRGHTNLLPAMVSIHGSTSAGYPKKSFKLTLAEPAPLLNLPERAPWVLNAAYIDRSLMRHKLAYDLFRSLSTKPAPRRAVASRFAEVYLNGRYNGAYLLMEKVDSQLLGLRAFHTNDVSHGCLYKAVDHAANFGHPGHAGFEQQEPDAVVLPYWQPLDEFDRFVSSSPDAEFFHPQTGIGSRLDLDNAVDFHLLVLVTGNVDGITKNFLIARDQPAPGQPSPRFFFVPWDYDGTFGRNWNAAKLAPAFWLSNHLFDRLRREAAYREKFVARWRALRDREFSPKTIQAMIDANARALGAAAERNAQRWPTSTGPYPDRATFAEDVAYMKTWIEARIRWLDQEIPRLLSPRR